MQILRMILVSTIDAGNTVSRARLSLFGGVYQLNHTITLLTFIIYRKVSPKEPRVSPGGEIGDVKKFCS